ncbi:phosphotransferase [Phyllobacterium myrsinacearum]|uniref:Hygromycin-B 4-O-kinase n=1 Tax=Phyllobacterium myrsinacearum TaxID=28101 RepID=A0A839EGU3_9HYPH|nr:phosphotransferase [Phyllobacterium myrsinacearum]MBA8876794.1 hygromycin-B 4-O-kinase [Phyllobacterium myrsinacearum]
MHKPDISLTAIIAKLRQLTGETIVLIPISEGEDSRAFRYDHAAGSFVVRVNRSIDGFAKDAFVWKHFSSAALPIPAVVDYGMLEDGNAYCISQMAKGFTLQELSPQQLPPVLEPVADIMAAIARSDIGSTHGYGPFDAGGNGRDATWQAFLSAVSAYDWSRVAGFPGAGRIDDLVRHCMTLIPSCPNIRALVHADFGSNNVLTDGRRITGVIDWSEAIYGDPLYEVANILFWRPWLECMEQQARYFEAFRPDLVRNQNVLACYQLRIGMQQIHESAIDGALADAGWALERCRVIESTLRQG